MRETWYKIYKFYCKKLDIDYPLKQSELSIKITNKIKGLTNVLEFYNKKLSKKEILNSSDDIASVYYSIFKEYGEKNFYNITDKIFNSKETIELGKTYKINLRTIISILYVSGYRNNELKIKTLNFINKE